MATYRAPPKPRDTNWSEITERQTKHGWEVSGKFRFENPLQLDLYIRSLKDARMTLHNPERKKKP